MLVKRFGQLDTLQEDLFHGTNGICFCLRTGAKQVGLPGNELVAEKASRPEQPMTYEWLAERADFGNDYATWDFLE